MCLKEFLYILVVHIFFKKIIFSVEPIVAKGRNTTNNNITKGKSFTFVSASQNFAQNIFEVSTNYSLCLYIFSGNLYINADGNNIEINENVEVHEFDEEISYYEDTFIENCLSMIDCFSTTLNIEFDWKRTTEFQTYF